VSICTSKTNAIDAIYLFAACTEYAQFTISWSCIDGFLFTLGHLKAQKNILKDFFKNLIYPLTIPAIFAILYG